MSQELEFQKRIGFDSNIQPIIEKLCDEYKIGKYVSYKVITTGYEDFNLVLQTKNRKYFVKMFANFRSDKDCQRYINIVTKILEVGVNHPKLYSSKQGVLYQTKIGDIAIRLCVMEFIDGETFYDLHRPPTGEEIKEIVNQATKINSLNYEPYFLDDAWDIANFTKEYLATEKYLTNNDKMLFAPLVKDFNNLDIEILPHTLVHGDLIGTNILKGKNGKIYFIDFSVANNYPRIQELAILLCNVFFDQNNLSNNSATYSLVIDEYCKHILLEKRELDILPTYLKLAHAMHIIGATREKYINGNKSLENEYWLNLGRIGLNYMDRLFKTTTRYE